jgi:hypothetical protein
MFSDLFGSGGVSTGLSSITHSGHVMPQNVAEFVWQRLSEWGLS